MSIEVIETRGARISYADRGEGGMAFLFLHYWGGSGRTWDRVVRELEGIARCIVPDQRGWGRSVARNDRFDLEAMADDVEDVAHALGLRRYVLVGHSRGGKVAQILAARGTPGLSGMVLVAPAPPEPMRVPPERREAMLRSYGSREGVEGAIPILAGRPLSEPERERVVADTLAGADGAKREWTERGMIAPVDAGLAAFRGPVRVLVGDRDRVEDPAVLRAAFAARLPGAVLAMLPGVGHLAPIEAPEAIAAACREVAAIVDAEGPAPSVPTERLEVGVVLYPGFTLLDVAGPEAALGPHAHVHLLARTREAVPSDGGVRLLPTGIFAEELPRLDVLFVPGGIGSRAAAADEGLVAAIKQLGSSARYVTSVCTGAQLLAAAGLLEDYEAATHWALRDELAAAGVRVVRGRVVRDRNRMTGGGVTAGLDFGLALLAELRGEEAAKLTQLMIEYDPAPPFRAGTPELAGPDLTRQALAAFARAEAAFRHPMP